MKIIYKKKFNLSKIYKIKIIRFFQIKSVNIFYILIYFHKLVNIDLSLLYIF